MMKAVQYFKDLWSSKARRQRLLCTNVETESLQTDSAAQSQTKPPEEPNLIDLDDDASLLTSLDPTPHPSSSPGARTDGFYASPVDPFPSDVWALDIPHAPIRWTKGELIGAGAFGKVYLGLNQETGQLMAVKQVQVPKEVSCRARVAEHVAALESEVKVLKHFRHHNIVRYLGTESCQDTLNIFLEYAAGGSVASLLSRFGAFEETLIRVFTRQILKGLEFLHQHKTAHRDIKGGNILVDHQGVVKLADFGASKRIENLATLNTGFKSLKGTPYWMAPEVIKQTGQWRNLLARERRSRGLGHGRQADIWSVGCTVIEMATGKPPWSEVANNVMFHIASATGPPPIPSYFSHEARDFLKLCFNRNPKERPNASRLLLHPFVAIAAHQEKLQPTPQWMDPFPSLPADAKAEILDTPPLADCHTQSLNLVSEPSQGMSIQPLPAHSGGQGETQLRPTVGAVEVPDTFQAFTREDLRQNPFLKAQWASELEKELKAMKDQGRKAMDSSQHESYRVLFP